MTAVHVACRAAEGGWTCDVRLTDERGTGHHEVRVSAADLDRLAPGATQPDDLVRRSVAFLLEREPRGSILRSFDLPAVGRYFPEYEATIRR